MENIEKNIAELNEVVKAHLGADYVGLVDQHECGQIAFVTNEPDCGERGTAKYYDFVKKEARKRIGFVSVLPYPVKGRLSYCIAGVGRVLRVA